MLVQNIYQREQIQQRSCENLHQQTLPHIARAFRYKYLAQVLLLNEASIIHITKLFFFDFPLDYVMI